MMATLVRHIMKIRYGKWDKFVEFSQKYGALTEAYDIPPCTIYRYDAGQHPTGSIVVEYLWESHTEMEAKVAKLWSDPKAAGLQELFGEAVDTRHVEYLTKLDTLE
jgi:hypothetical protein